MGIEQAILIGLAAWRMTALLSYERGPFDMFARLRRLLGFAHDDEGRPSVWPDGVLQNVIACPWCLGLPMAAVAFGLWQVVPLAVIVLAAASVVVAVERWTNG